MFKKMLNNDKLVRKINIITINFAFIILLIKPEILQNKVFGIGTLADILYLILLPLTFLAIFNIRKK
jgi:hypothetical protein